MASIAEPKITSWIAVRSASFAAHAYISSMVLGGVRTSKRPSAFAGPWLQPIKPAMPATASVPCLSARWVMNCIGSR